MIRSLRWRLLAGIAVTIVAGFAIAAVSSYALMQASLLREFDALLGLKARALVTLVEQRGSGFEIEIEFADHEMQEFTRQRRPEYFQVWEETGKVLAKSRQLAASDLVLAAGSLESPGFQFVILPDGRPGRQVAIHFLPAIEGKNLDHEAKAPGKEIAEELDKADLGRRRRVVLVVARETAEIDQAVAGFGWILFGIFSSVIVATLGVLAWLVKHSLHPLNELATQIAILDEHALSFRFQINNAPSELDPIVSRLNELLCRLAEAFQRERVLAADVAHELRTPLTGLRTTLEVALSKDRGKEEYRQSLQDCQAISVDTQRLVETLLTLAKIESGQLVVDQTFVDVKKLVAESWQPYEAKVREKSLQVAFSGPAGVLLDTNANQLRVVLANIFNNAVDYTEYQGSIQINWAVTPAGLRMTFANSGCNLSEGQTQKVFDRFWQADTARSATGLHAGLGLALCKRIIDLLGGSIIAKNREASFVVTIDFAAEYLERADENGESEEPGKEQFREDILT